MAWPMGLANVPRAALALCLGPRVHSRRCAFMLGLDLRHLVLYLLMVLSVLMKLHGNGWRMIAVTVVDCIAENALGIALHVHT